jgi:zinc protease
VAALAWAAGWAQKAPGTPGSDPSAAKTGAAGRGAAVPAAAAATYPSPKDLKYPPARTPQMTPSAAFTLPNGMKVVLHEDHDLPVVSGNILVRTGSVLDPPERIGLAQLTGTVLRTGGTALKTADQMNEMLENLGSTIETGIGLTRGNVSFFALKENTDAVLLLLKELLTQPGFRPEKLDQARLQLRNAISHRNDKAETLVGQELRSMIYGGDSPYGWQIQYDTIDRITRSDVRNFYQRYFFPANMLLGVRGDFKSAEMKASLEKLFADWTVQQKPVPEFPKVKTVPSPGIFLAEKRELTQTIFTIGQLGVQYNDKDYAVLEIMANVLGGNRGRLVERARARGNPAEFKTRWTAHHDHPGLFEITGNTRSISTVETIKAVQEEIERLRTAEISEDELKVAREAALSAAIFSADSKEKIFASIMGDEYYGYPKDFPQAHQKALQAVTRADVMRAAKQALTPANLTVVVAGNAMLFGDSLDRLGPVAKLDITIPTAKPGAAEFTDATLAQGKQILAKAQAAAGGADRLDAVRDYSMQAEYLISTAVPSIGGAKIVQMDRWVSPTSFRQDATMPAGRVSAYTDGKIGWIATPQGWGALAGVQSKQVLGDLFRVYFRLLLSDRLEGRTVNAIDENTVQISDAGGQVASVDFDPQTGLIRRVSYDTAQAAGQPIYSEDVFDDFRDIGGVKIPFKITINQGGRKFSDVVVTEYKINTGLKSIDISKRPQ